MNFVIAFGTDIAVAIVITVAITVAVVVTVVCAFGGFFLLELVSSGLDNRVGNCIAHFNSS